jgi:uncharacterized integral membrane protein (TIGR00697 family)
MQLTKPIKLFLFLGCFFVSNALIAEFIGVKIFSLEGTMGWQTFEWHLWGQSGSLQFTAGVILWPVVFIMTDIINEYFGHRGVRLLSVVAAVLIAYAFLMVYLAIQLAPAEWWKMSGVERGVPDMQAAFSSVFGQGMWIILGSLTAFFIGQLTDVFIFHRIKAWTGDQYIWLRATGSTLVSQFIDSFVVLYIAFVLGPAHWSMGLFFAVGIVNYVYKFQMAIILTPVLYLVHYAIDAYLGHDVAYQMRHQAMQKKSSEPTPKQ